MKTLHLEKAERLAALSVALNLFLVGLKYGLAQASGSRALMADAVHSLTDVVASLSLLLGLHVSRRKSRRFPYGLYKLENLAALVTSGLILYAAFEILMDALHAPSGQALRNVPLGMAGVALATLLALLFSIYEGKIGRELRSPGLIADAAHVRTDVFSELVILIGLAGSLFHLSLDRAAAVIVVLFVAHSGIEIAVDAVRVLLDASIEFSTLDKVKSIILSEKGVVEVKNLLGRNAGRYRFIEAEIVVRENQLEKAHRLAERIENRIKEEVENVDHVLIHYEPVRKTRLLCAVPLDTRDGGVSEHFGDANYFGFFEVDLAEGRVVSESVERNPYLSVERAKGITVAEWLVEKGVDRVYARTEFQGRGPVYVFSDAGVEMFRTDAARLEEVIGEALASLKQEASEVAREEPGTQHKES